MNRHLSTIALLFASIVSLSFERAKCGPIVLDQSFTQFVIGGPSTLSAGAAVGGKLAQTFTVGVTGQLVEADLFIHTLTGATGDSHLMFARLSAVFRFKTIRWLWARWLLTDRRCRVQGLPLMRWT